jgi:hypothetical protein
MPFPPSVQAGLVGLLFALGFTVERTLPPERTLDGLTGLGKMVVLGGAIGLFNYLVFSDASVGVAGLDETVVALALMLAVLVAGPFALPAASDAAGGGSC